MSAGSKAQQLGRFLASAASGSCGLQAAGPWAWRGQAPYRALASSAASAAAEQPAASVPSSIGTGAQDKAGAGGSSSSSTPGSSSSSSSSNSSSSSSSSSSSDADGYRVMYQGFFARPHKRLKYASLLNTFASFAAAPLIVTYSSASPVARVAVTVSVLTFAIITTGGLHWFTSPYVHQLLYNDKTDVAKVQTLRFFGGTKWFEFPVSSVEAPTGYHPLASFKVLGKTYYIDRANFAQQDLLDRLVPGSSSEAFEEEPSPPASSRNNTD